MKIALVHPFAWPDVRRGGERYLDDLAWYLRGAGHQVDVIAGATDHADRWTTATGDELRLRHLPNVTMPRLHTRLREPETFGARVLPILLRTRYDVVHALVPSAALAARVARQPTVFTLLGYPSEQLFTGHPVKRAAFLRAARAAQAVTSLSEQVRTDVLTTFGVATVVVPPGVRTTDFVPQTRNATPTILFASAMRPEKGVDVLLRAFSVLASQRDDVRLVLCGPGEVDWAFDAVDGACDAVRDRIDVVGAGDPAELPERYARAHVTVLPSRQEAFGLVLAESLAAGTPVVGCRGGGADDIVTDAVGRIVDFGDHEALASAIGDALSLAQQPDIAARCVSRAQTWDWAQSVGPAHEALYRGLRAG